MWMLPVEKRNGLLVSLIEISHELKEKHSCFGRKPEPELIGHLSLLSVESHLLAILYERLPLPPPALTKPCMLPPETQIIQLRFNQLKKIWKTPPLLHIALETFLVFVWQKAICPSFLLKYTFAHDSPSPQTCMQQDHCYRWICTRHEFGSV